MGIVGWIKRNKLASILLVIVIVFVFPIFRQILYGLLFGSISMLNLNIPASQESSAFLRTSPSADLGGTTSFGGTSQFGMPPPISYSEAPPQPGIKDRLVIEESNLSLLVKDVVTVRDKIIKHAQESGGYMVNSTISNPQDAPTATVVIRVPSAQLESTLAFLRSLAVKVVSENLMGKDVTDQYVDIEKRIQLLEKTKARYEEILAQAKEISDISNLTQQILNVQSQIDSYLGQKEALAKNAELAKLTIYLSTDEIALPYAPSETWRPDIIFKQAVRSLIKTLRSLGTLSIWLAVYSVIWVPVVLVIIFFKRRRTQQIK